MSVKANIQIGGGQAGKRFLLKLLANTMYITYMTLFKAKNVVLSRSNVHTSHVDREQQTDVGVRQAGQIAQCMQSVLRLCLEPCCV